MRDSAFYIHRGRDLPLWSNFLGGSLIRALAEACACFPVGPMARHLAFRPVHFPGISLFTSPLASSFIQQACALRIRLGCVCRVTTPGSVTDQMVYSNRSARRSSCSSTLDSYRAHADRPLETPNPIRSHPVQCMSSRLGATNYMACTILLRVVVVNREEVLS